jgi:hypothetical protein
VVTLPSTRCRASNPLFDQIVVKLITMPSIECGPFRNAGEVGSHRSTIAEVEIAHECLLYRFETWEYPCVAKKLMGEIAGHDTYPRRGKGGQPDLRDLLMLRLEENRADQAVPHSSEHPCSAVPNGTFQFRYAPRTASWATFKRPRSASLRAGSSGLGQE